MLEDLHGEPHKCHCRQPVFRLWQRIFNCTPRYRVGNVHMEIPVFRMKILYREICFTSVIMRLERRKAWIAAQIVFLRRNKCPKWRHCLDFFHRRIDQLQHMRDFVGVLHNLVHIGTLNPLFPVSSRVQGIPTSVMFRGRIVAGKIGKPVTE